MGFIIAPWLAPRVTSFLQFPDRIASLKLKTRRGKFGFITAYAPHNLKPYDERRSFYSELITVLGKCRVNGPRYVLGDLNARIGQQRTGEKDIFGPYSFGKEASHKVESPNRELLLEFCADFKYVAANTFFDMPAEQKVTFAEAGSRPIGPVNEDSFHMLDLVLVPEGALANISEIRSVRNATLATDHFVLLCSLQDECETSPDRGTRAMPDRSLLSNSITRNSFVEAFKQNHSNASSAAASWQSISGAMKAAGEVLPLSSTVPNKPWISAATLDLISQRQAARACDDYVEEKLLHKAVRVSARKDRTVWADTLLEDGSWGAIKKIRKPRQIKQGRLRDAR